MEKPGGLQSVGFQSWTRVSVWVRISLLQKSQWLKTAKVCFCFISHVCHVLTGVVTHYSHSRTQADIVGDTSNVGFNDWGKENSGKSCLALKCSGGSDDKESSCNAGDLGSIPGSGKSSGEWNGNHSSIRAWRIPWTEEPDGLQSVGSQSRSQLRE